VRSRRDDALSAALWAASDTSRPRDDCPDADRIWRAVAGEVPLDERLALIDHTVDCPTCAEAWRLAMELGARAPTASDERFAPALWLRRPEVRWAAAAVLVIGLGVVLVLRTSSPPPDPVLRDPGVGGIQSVIESGSSLPRENAWLRWTGGPTGARYDLTVTTADLDVLVFVTGLEHPEYRIPPDRLSGLAPGARVLWRVVARAPSGGTTASPTFEISID
jgi:hypothetical protein